jgi:hypothetical protein
MVWYPDWNNLAHFLPFARRGENRSAPPKIEIVAKGARSASWCHNLHDTAPGKCPGVQPEPKDSPVGRKGAWSPDHPLNFKIIHHREALIAIALYSDWSELRFAIFWAICSDSFGRQVPSSQFACVTWRGNRLRRLSFPTPCHPSEVSACGLTMPPRLHELQPTPMIRHFYIQAPPQLLARFRVGVENRLHRAAASRR